MLDSNSPHNEIYTETISLLLIILFFVFDQVEDNL